MIYSSYISSIQTFPLLYRQVIEGYTKDLIDLYNYKPWMRESSSHALMELLSALSDDANSSAKLIVDITNNVIIPSFLLPKKENSTDWEHWLKTLSAEQIAVALYLQTHTKKKKKLDYPLNNPVITAESISTLVPALAATSCVVYPRCHAAWNTLWMHLTEKTEGGYRQLQSDKEEEYTSIIEQIIEHVVVNQLLKGGESKASNDCRSLALQIVCALCGSSELKIVLPPSLIGSVLCPEVVTTVFINVLCATGGWGKKSGGSNVEHHLKPLTSKALGELVEYCCQVNGNAERRLAFVKAFLLAEPRFDTKSKTSTVSSLLMLEEDSSTMSEESKSMKEALIQSYLSFLEEEIVSATTLHHATVYIELMYKFAKRDLTSGSANEVAKRVIKFFMSGAFFDCSELSAEDNSATTNKKGSSKKKKKGKAKNTAESNPPPQELSSGLRIKEILKEHEITSISHPTRSIMSARFYSLLSEFVVSIKAKLHGSGKGSAQESIYRILYEINGISSLLSSSGAKQYQSLSLDLDDDSDNDEDPVETSKEAMLRVQNIANEALVKECGGSGDKDLLHAKAVFTTSCASLMMSLHLQLNSCGKPDSNNGKEEEEEDQDDEEDEDIIQSVHEFISDLADSVEAFCSVIEGEKLKKTDDNDDENPLAMLVGLLVNILSSAVGGEDVGNEHPIQAARSKLARESVKLAWSNVISVITGLSAKNESLKNLVDEDVMSILIESVCGEKSMEDKEEGEDESIDDESDSSEALGDSAVFVDASGMDLDEEVGNSSDDESSSQESTDDDKDEDVELDPTKLENLLLEDSDAEMSDSGMGILEHHAGADKALAQLIKLKQEARKESQTERERIDLCYRLRCAGLLDALFSPSVFKSGWLPLAGVLGSIVPILRSRKAIEKSIASSTSTNTKKSLSEKKALLDRLTVLVKDKISKFRISANESSEELVLKASSDIYEEMKRSLSLAHCSCCSVALITTLRCIPNVEDSDEVKDIYVSAIDDWSSRKATKIHTCVFEDLIHRMPSLASLILIEPLAAASKDAHSPFMKCSSIKILSSIYKHDGSEESMSQKAISNTKKSCSKVVETLISSLADSSLTHKAKLRDEVLNSTKHFINYIKGHEDEGLLSSAELSSLKQSISEVGDKKSGRVKQNCEQLVEALSKIDLAEKKKQSKRTKTPKSSSKKQKKSKK